MSAHTQHSQLPRRTSRCSVTQLPRSSRVEKPKSHHNSPKTMERRKTTTEPKLYATLDDHYKMMFGIEDSEEEVEERPQPSRPVSWHPSSNQWFAPQTSGYVASPSQQEWSWHTPSRNSGHGSDFYSLSTQNSTYNANRQTYHAGTGMHMGSDESDHSWQHQSQSYAHPPSTPHPLNRFHGTCNSGLRRTRPRLPWTHKTDPPSFCPSSTLQNFTSRWTQKTMGKSL